MIYIRPLENMSARELQKAVHERSQALKERDEALRKHTELEKAPDDQTGKIARLSTERDELKGRGAGDREWIDLAPVDCITR
ncbi:hypothetical protein [Candidatus Desulfosporosinus nitrosoreducens]|uniref:hypothetical protein n=1 Tax=Candidatus Desulfosporosinus nitrosoreducens TaxID=3401928 RepID=UPI00280AF908|nr:hypothetical protein [Desulfosporosinus sp. PR]